MLFRSLACVQAAARMAPQAAPGRDPATAWWLTSVVVALAALGMRSTASRVAASLVVVAILWAAPPRALLPGAPRLVVLDVGHGDAVVAQERREQLALGGEVAIHVAVEVQVVPTQVREHSHPEATTVDAAERDGVEIGRAHV